MRIALCQLDARLGDVEANLARILAAHDAARADGADLAVFPELALTGYPPKDLLFRPDLLGAVEAAESALAEASRALPLVVGSARRTGRERGGRPRLWNEAVLFAGGEARVRHAKRLLPVYDVFDEARYFEAGTGSAIVEVAGHRIGLLVCEDLWADEYDVDPAAAHAAAGADLLVAINASPYRVGGFARRLAQARRPRLPIVYVNAVGGQDDLVFDGQSFALDPERGADPIARLAAFEERVETIDIGPDARRRDDAVAAPLDPPEEMFRALVTGTRAFAQKNGLGHAFLGLSGGIDSALVACVAKEALGSARVTAVALPSRYSDARSTTSARELASALGIGFEVVPIEPLHAAAEAALSDLLDADGPSTVGENIQARIRGLALMAFVNRRGGLLLNTSNKTELALGYGTLYGDLAGGLSVIGDVSKPSVYALARWYDRTRGGAIIPRFILERAPSAELRPGQVDPFDYDRVSRLVDQLLDGNRSPEDLIEGGEEPDEVWRVERLIRASEHKRWQAPPALKLTDDAFAGRRVPITQRLPGRLGARPRGS